MDVDPSAAPGDTDRAVNGHSSQIAGQSGRDVIQGAFFREVADVWGGLTEVLRSATEPQKVAAEFFGVTPVVLQYWIAAKGRHYCAGLHLRGSRCRNIASPLTDYSPLEWSQRPAVFCKLHGPVE